MEAEIPPQPTEIHSGADPPAARRAPKGGCDPVGDLHWNSLFLKGSTPHKGPTLDGACGRDPHWRSSCAHGEYLQ